MANWFALCSSYGTDTVSACLTAATQHRCKCTRAFGLPGQRLTDSSQIVSGHSQEFVRVCQIRRWITQTLVRSVSKFQWICFSNRLTTASGSGSRSKLVKQSDDTQRLDSGCKIPLHASVAVKSVRRIRTNAKNDQRPQTSTDNRAATWRIKH